MQKLSGFITLTTDFGIGSSYIAAMNGVILSLYPKARIFDLFHAVPPQDISQGAQVLEEISVLYPPGTIHIAVVDPGVGTRREIILAQIGSQYYIAPNNGLLGRLAQQAVLKKEKTAFYSLTNQVYWRQEISNTFHGRDIMAPVAAHLLNGIKPEELGVPIDEIVYPSIPEPVADENSISGIVERIDSFGNLITNITLSALKDRPLHDTVKITISGVYETTGVYRTYADQPVGTLTAIIDSSDHLEIAIVNGNAAEMLMSKTGEPVVMKWE